MGKEFASNVVVANEYTLLGTGSVSGMLTINAAVAEIKVGANKLEGRTVVTLNAHPDNTGYVYVDLLNTVSAAQWFLCLAAGDKIEIRLDSVDALSLYAYGSAAGQKLGVCEAKAS